MERVLILITFLIFTGTRVDCQTKFSIELNSRIGYDFQTRSNNYNLTGPLIIPSPIKSSVLHIDKPIQYSFGIGYELNENLNLLIDLGQTSRALRYWSIDTIITSTTFQNDKLNLKIRNYFVDLGVRFTTNTTSRLNIFWDQTFGIGFGKSSPRFSLTKEHPQAELIYLNDRRVAALVNVSFENPIISINSNIGTEYKISKKLFLTLGVKFVNELTNSNDLIIWQYDIKNDRRTGAYSPYDLEFKTFYSEFGVKFKI